MVLKLSSRKVIISSQPHESGLILKCRSIQFAILKIAGGSGEILSLTHSHWTKAIYLASYLVNKSSAWLLNCEGCLAKKKTHYSLEQVLRPRSQHELLVDFHVEFGPFGLELSTACCCPRIRALKNIMITAIIITEVLSPNMALLQKSSRPHFDDLAPSVAVAISFLAALPCCRDSRCHV